MTLFWMVFGAVAGGSLGWFYDRRLKKQREVHGESQPQEDCGG